MKCIVGMLQKWELLFSQAKCDNFCINLIISNFQKAHCTLMLKVKMHYFFLALAHEMNTFKISTLKVFLISHAVTSIYPKSPSVLLQASSILQYWTFKLHVFIFFSSIYNPWDILQQHSFERKNLLTRNIMFFNMIPRALIKARLKTLSRHRIRSRIINKQYHRGFFRNNK